MSENTVIIRPEVLETFVTELFMKADMSEEDAKFHAEALVKTNLMGVDSHGVIRVPAYFERLYKKAVNPRPNIKARKGSLGLQVLDGDDGAGFIVARDAMKKAIELAKTHNIGAVGAIRSNHFGAASLYTRMAAEAGMIGIAMTNVIPLIVAPGASKPVTGNNPYSIAIPSYGDFPFCLDLSHSVVAGGKLTLAIKKGEKIPTDWATDKDGRPTDDPKKAFEGFLLPMGGYKGLGLAYAVDILSGLITGGIFGHELKSMYAAPDDPSLTGHFMIAINVEAIMGKEELKERMNEYYKNLKSTPMWKEGMEMYLPGELEHLKTIERMEKGIPVPKKTYEELKELAERMNVKSPLTLM